MVHSVYLNQTERKTKVCKECLWKLNISLVRTLSTRSRVCQTILINHLLEKQVQFMHRRKVLEKLLTLSKIFNQRSWQIGSHRILSTNLSLNKPKTKQLNMHLWDRSSSVMSQSTGTRTQQIRRSALSLNQRKQCSTDGRSTTTKRTQVN